jgi:hypothetical protein
MQTKAGGSDDSSRYILYSEVPGGVFRIHGSFAVPAPLTVVFAISYLLKSKVCDYFINYEQLIS